MLWFPFAQRKNSLAQFFCVTQRIGTCKKKSRQKNPSPILPVIASSSPHINATMAPVQITHILATVHHPQIYPAQAGFVQWTLPSSVAGSSRRRRSMPYFGAGREERMCECPGRNSRANCQFF